MIENIAAYLAQLKQELADSDPAIIQDALADSEEYLRNALDQVQGIGSEITQAEALVPIIDKYGTPEETASAYREMATLTYPLLFERAEMTQLPFMSRFFGILGDANAWGALLYFMFSWITGIVYFAWGITGLSLSLGLLILIIGLPFTVVFLLSVRSIVLLEGRMVEALLGVRMPRRSFFTNRKKGWWEQIKDLFLEIRTWSALTYMFMQLPLGLVYFVAFFTLISFSVAVIVNPFLVYVLDLHVVNIGWEPYINNPELTIPFVFVGLILLVATLHLAKIIGRLHAIYAKALLVGGFREIEEYSESMQNRATQIPEESMEIKDQGKHEIDRRPPTFVIVLSIAFFLFAIGLVMLAYLTVG